IASITPEGLLDHIKYLADDALEGRASGTEGGRKAADYIAEHFRSYGLTPLGADGSYFQPFDFSLGRRSKLGSKNRLQATGAGPDSFEVGKDWSPFSFSPPGDATGPLLFAGYGLVWQDQGYDDYAGVDPTGKVVLILRHTPGESRPDSPFKDRQGELGTFTNKAARAQERGAAALVIVNDPNNHKDQPDRLVTFEQRMPGGGIKIP